MRLRSQLPVSSPIAPLSLVRAAARALRGGAGDHERVAALLAERFGARAAALTDSGTSALVLALRLAVGAGGTVAFPAYACIDLAAAARHARVRVRLYDVDPATLSPDLESLEQALTRGVDAVLVAHLYGFPADVPAVAALAAEYGARVIEDAAQGAGGRLAGVTLGAFGPLAVLSFGRGKGTTGGNGGALLATTPAWADRVAEQGARLGALPAGWRDVAAAAAQWLVGRPGLYGIPSSIPALRLGEMVYHPAHDPVPLSVGAAALVRAALARDAAEVAVRRHHAGVLRAALPGGDGLSPVDPLAGGESGYLRFPVRVTDGRAAAPALGVLPGYPRTLAEQEELRPCLHAGEEEQPGALELRRTLHTLPVHGRVAERDLAALSAWLRAGGAAHRR